MGIRGFTLVELIVVVAIIGILSVVGIPMYNGYLTTADETVIKNNLRAIYMQQQEYLANNNIYYSTGASCTDSASAINTNLFSGKQVIESSGYNYCITQTTTTDFTAQADQSPGSKLFTINDSNNVSW